MILLALAAQETRAGVSLPGELLAFATELAQVFPEFLP